MKSSLNAANKSLIYPKHETVTNSARIINKKNKLHNKYIKITKDYSKHRSIYPESGITRHTWI